MFRALCIATTTAASVCTAIATMMGTVRRARLPHVQLICHVSCWFAARASATVAWRIRPTAAAAANATGTCVILLCSAAAATTPVVWLAKNINLDASTAVHAVSGSARATAATTRRMPEIGAAALIAVCGARVRAHNTSLRRVSASDYIYIGVHATAAAASTRW